MTQTTGQISFVNAKIEISTNGSSWTDISGHTSSIDVPAQARASGEAYTFDGDTALITGGKREPVEITVRIIYTEADTDAFEVVEAEFETDDGDPLYLRWTPKGSGANTSQYATGACEIVSFQYPGGDASSADPIMTEFVLKAASITRSTLTA